MWLQTPFKKDTISTLGGRYNESIILHASHQTCPFVTAAHLPNIESIGHVQLQGTHNANTHLDAVEDAAHGRASASRCRSVSLHLDAARI